MVKVINAFLHGLERPLILWLLSQGPRHGYRLIEELKRLTGQKSKPGMVYPFLHWLEDEGFAVSEWVKRNGRNLRRYRLTEKGKGLLRKVRNFFNKPIRRVIADLLSEQKQK
ncbi:MAG: PadR family transcriptional regulator [Candidatus Bathyarchaeia archaeon]